MNETEREQRTIVIGTSLSDELVTSAEIGLNLRDVNVHHIRHDFGFANEIWATWRSDRKRRSGTDPSRPIFRFLSISNE